MSTSAMVRSTLKQGDTLNVAFSIQTPEGEWCELRNVRIGCE